MILEKLLLAEFTVQDNIETEEGKLKAIRSIRSMLNGIDFNSEVVIDDDEKRLTRLLASLKGDSLSKVEMELIQSIVNQEYK